MKITRIMKGRLRKSGWDYSGENSYLITIVTKNRRQYLGTIRKGQLVTSEQGLIAHKCWHLIPHFYPKVKIGAFVAMPDHIHGIIHFQREEGEPPVPNEFGPQGVNLGRVIRSFKSGVTMKCREAQLEFQWQSRYHDRILWNDRAVRNATQYIIDNPKKISM